MEAQLPAGIDLTANPVVQEALAAAARARFEHATVHVRYGDDAVDHEVLDDGAGERTLIGIRERVALHGGRLTSEHGRGTAHPPVGVAGRRARSTGGPPPCWLSPPSSRS